MAISSAELNGLSNFGRGHHEEHFCEIILKWNHGSGGYIAKIYFLSRGMVALLFCAAESFVQF